MPAPHDPRPAAPQGEPDDACVYRIMTRAEWAAAMGAGAFHGGALDRRDGFIHLSRAHQVGETLRVHFAGVADLLILEIAVACLGAALRYEPSREGALFPHLYAALPVTAVTRASAPDAWPADIWS